MDKDSPKRQRAIVPQLCRVRESEEIIFSKSAGNPLDQNRWKEEGIGFEILLRNRRRRGRKRGRKKLWVTK